MNNNDEIKLCAEDWKQLAWVMRDLTVGKDCAETWWRLYKKVLDENEKRHNKANVKSQTS